MTTKPSSESAGIERMSVGEIIRRYPKTLEVFDNGLTLLLREGGVKPGGTVFLSLWVVNSCSLALAHKGSGSPLR